jgi:uncharacterized protein YfaT (DUF1175 family)
VFQKEFYEILQILQEQREAGKVWIATMGDLASYCEARESMSLQARTERDQTMIQISSSLDSEKYGSPEVTLIVPAQRMPKRIQRKMGSVSDELAAEAVCARKNGTLIVNVPTATQTLTLSF